MKRTLVILVALAVMAAAFAGAQSTVPGAGDIGIGGSVSSSRSVVQVFYNVTDSIVLAPLAGYSNRNDAFTSAGSTTNYPDTWWEAGLGLYYTARSFDFLSVQVGPAFYYSSESYKNESSSFPVGDTVAFTYWEIDLNLQLTAMITRSLGVYTSVGVFYWSNDWKDSAAALEIATTKFGVATPSLGVVYYFK